MIQNEEKNGPLAGWMQAARKVVSEWRSIGEETPEPIAEYSHADEVSTGEEEAAGGHLCKEPPIRDVEYSPDADACSGADLQTVAADAGLHLWV